MREKNIMNKYYQFLILLLLVGCDLFNKTPKFDIPSGSIIKKSTDNKGKDHIFVYDQSTPPLGEAWKDESGMIWGDVVRNSDLSFRYLDHEQATDYCRKIGAILPSENDFTRLREYMGANSGIYEGYTPQVLPNLFRKDGNKMLSNFFWSSTADWFHYHLAYVFGGKIGGFGLVNRLFADDFTTARCVIQR